jgi:hypothetical protein
MGSKAQLMKLSELLRQLEGIQRVAAQAPTADNPVLDPDVLDRHSDSLCDVRCEEDTDGNLVVVLR